MKTLKEVLNKLYKVHDETVVYDIINRINVLDLATALEVRKVVRMDEAYMGGLWDLAFNETKQYIFKNLSFIHTDDAAFCRYNYIAECVYNELVEMFDNEL